MKSSGQSCRICLHWERRPGSRVLFICVMPKRESAGGAERSREPPAKPQHQRGSSSTAGGTRPSQALATLGKARQSAAHSSTAPVIRWHFRDKGRSVWRDLMLPEYDQSDTNKPERSLPRKDKIPSERTPPPPQALFPTPSSETFLSLPARHSLCAASFTFTSGSGRLP